jgi:hypothetical protein
MPTVTMPDGTLVDMPDTIDAQLGARLRAFHTAHSQKSPQDYDPVPTSGVPEGFYAVTGDDGKKTLRRERGALDTIEDIPRALGDLPGVGMAQRVAQGGVRLAGKAASGIAGLFGADPKAIQNTVNTATELPPSNDPLVTAANVVGDVASRAAAPVDRAVSNLPPGPRTAIEATEEAVPDIASVLGMHGAVPEASAVAPVARTAAEVADAAGYTGLKTRADLRMPGNQAITDTLISQDAGIVPGQTPSIAALENARRVGPGRVYAQTEATIPHKLTMDESLQADLGNLPQQVSQLPRSPDVAALQETMLAQPEFTRDELFANIREARERAKAHWKSDDPDKGALGDAYHSLANAYEDFAGRKLEESGSDISLADWQAARTQMAKNYQAQGALRGPQGAEHFNPQVFAGIAERNPHLLTGNAAIVGHVANGLPAAEMGGTEGLMAAGLGAAAGEAAGHFAGVPVVGGMAGAVAGPMLRAKLEQLRTRGNPTAAAGTTTDPALSYFFNRDQMPPGWNRSPVTPQIAGLLPPPAMVNAGGGASTANTLENLGLTPDVQAAGAQHPGAARLQALRETLTRPPMEEIPFQGPQKWGDFSIAPPQAGAPPTDGIPSENVLEQGGTDKPPVGAPSARYRPPSKSPNQNAMRTPPGAPELAAGPLPGPSTAQLAFRNKLAADRLRKVAGDLSVEGPGGSSGDPLARVREALKRHERGYADGGEVVRGSSSPGTPGVSGAVRDALAALRNYFVDRPRREIQAQREQYENSIIDDTNTAARPAPAKSRTDYAAGGRIGFAKGGSVPHKEVRQVRPIQDLPRDKNGMFIQPDELTDEIAVWVEHNRQRAEKAYYADEYCGKTKTVDPKRKYNCGGCNQADGDKCLWVYDDKKKGNPPLTINRAKGSCGPWEIIDRDDPEQRGNRMPASVAGYAVRVGGEPEEVFSCEQCWKGIKSKWAPILKRGTWCGEWGTTVQPGACCVVNGAPTVER